MTKYIILLSAVMAFACGYDCEKRKIDALERIATALEKINRNCDNQSVEITRTVEIPVYVPQQPTPKKTYQSRVNGRSLKAVPTIDTECIDECMMELSPSRRDNCIETKCGGEND